MGEHLEDAGTEKWADPATVRAEIAAAGASMTDPASLREVLAERIEDPDWDRSQQDDVYEALPLLLGAIEDALFTLDEEGHSSIEDDDKCPLCKLHDRLSVFAPAPQEGVEA